MRIARVERFMVGLRKRGRLGGDASPDDEQDRGKEARAAMSIEGRRGVASDLSIADLMERDLATVSPEDSVLSAVALMIENRVSSVPVVDVDGRIVGALNEGDLMQVFYQPRTKCVGDVMTRKPIVVSIDAPLVDVIDHLMSSNFRRVLIRDGDRLVGVITRSHVMPALLTTLEAMGSD